MSAWSWSPRPGGTPALVVPVTAALAVLAAIFARLRGDVSVLQASRANLLLPPVPVHDATGTLVAVDGLEHFTSSRLAALQLYPPDAAVGFDVGQHMQLCRDWSARADAVSPGLPAKAFGFGGVQRERAYQDALRDLATAAMGHPPAGADRRARGRWRRSVRPAPVGARRAHCRRRGRRSSDKMSDPTPPRCWTLAV